MSIRNKKKWLIIVGLTLLVAGSQWWLVYLVYARSLPEPVAALIARTYGLKAGSVVRDDQKLNIYIYDYFLNQDIAHKFILAQESKANAAGDQSYPSPDKQEIDQIVWRKTIKDAWLDYMSRKVNIRVLESEVDAYLQKSGDQAALREEAEKDFNLSFEDYQRAVIEPFILEAKVYDYLLVNFSDQPGAQRAQEAYQALELGQNFVEVAKEYSDDPVAVDKSLWLSEDSLRDFYEPIKDLKKGEFSEIVIAPGAYVIWYVRDVIQEEDKAPVWEVRGIFIQAKSMESFLDDYLAGAQVNRIY